MPRQAILPHVTIAEISGQPVLDPYSQKNKAGTENIALHATGLNRMKTAERCKHYTH